jgi:putative transposase
VRYRRKRKDDDADRKSLRALAAERRRFGYRRLRERARRKGNVMNLKKVYRLYREEGLMVRRRRGRKRALGTRAPLQSARRPNEVWVLDFVADVLESGRRFRVFNVEDQFTRTGLATEVDTSLPSARIVRVLDRLLSEHDKPLLIVSDKRHRQRDAQVDRDQRHRMALHRARQAAAERLHGKLQWQAARRMPQRTGVLIAG